jgi:hypothetical protein
MRNIGVRQRRQNTSLPAHRVVAVGARVLRRPAQHELTLAPAKSQQNILRATLQRRNILDRSPPDLLIIHPARQSCEIDDFVDYLRRHARLDNESAEECRFISELSSDK